ncbi:phosphonate ABC transporter, permease protein PhnE [Halalkalibacter sp. APA_J-10(15)]|uniref:phosphonate ABC transporter, permease protein PhnE n=1 Tax=Halalkalibacter sp. APA_J-10(15) TaxID=2933805 RepID=UPI001FF57C82|nr:phosphonate ABC transporter, permease protein PhnE [Halalkalibacter sp. APA_J-10(15)]MCK0470230.1 phosphonate ABC transporter, permease protein PhnE [Halalkalibacter sp. APA_J-10(15)]
MKQEHLLEVQRNKNLLLWGFVVVLVLLTIWSAFETGFSIPSLFSGATQAVSFIMYDLFPPDFSVLVSLIPPALDTIYMSFVAMVIGAIIATGLAFLAAATTSPHPSVQIFMRGFSSLFRNIPVFIWAIVLTASFGLGVLVGTLSLIIVSVGALTRAFAEVLEEIDMGQLEAVKATGANYFQVLAQGVMPQFLPGFFGWTLYMLEINVRASTIIGMVGGGGLGFVIQSNIKLFQYGQVCMGVILILFIVLMTEWLTNQIRERII